MKSTPEQAWTLADQWFLLAFRELARWGFRGGQRDAKQELWLCLFLCFKQYDSDLGPPIQYAVFAAKYTRARLLLLDADLRIGFHGLEKYRQLGKGALPADVGLSDAEARTLTWSCSYGRYRYALENEEIDPVTMSYDDSDRLEGIADCGFIFDAAEDVLTRRDQRILALRHHGMPLASIGGRVGLGRERVRQVCLSAALEIQVALTALPVQVRKLRKAKKRGRKSCRTKKPSTQNTSPSERPWSSSTP